MSHAKKFYEVYLARECRLFRLLTMLGVAAILLLALARSANTESAQSAVEASLHFFHAVTLSGKELQPGIYSLMANSSKVMLKQSDKVVAEAPVQWKDGDKMEFATYAVLSGKDIKEIRFAGRTRYAVIQPCQLNAKCYMQSLELGVRGIRERLRISSLCKPLFKPDEFPAHISMTRSRRS